MNQDARRNLEDLLDREIEAARLLSTTLAAERGALTGTSPESVQEKAAEKIQLLDMLERLERERQAVCAQTGLDVSGNAGDANAPKAGGMVSERWRSLMELMAGCRAANEVNGYIIHVRQNQVRQLMDILRGTTPVTYGPQGKTFARALRALARA
ncbi:MAG TPA: flagellar protein FlgN [Steroidobacteraceae bacterium]|jgi:flagella synthesis protein FlgN|nr:flagellar protein FlgN [Steroidobacteraceae bacterium]